MLALFRLERRNDCRDLFRAEHGNFSLDFRHSFRLFPHDFLVVFLCDDRLNQFLLRGTQLFIELADFLRVRLRGFAQQFHLLFVQAPAASKISASPALRIWILIAATARATIAAIAPSRCIRIRIRGGVRLGTAEFYAVLDDVPQAFEDMKRGVVIRSVVTL